MERNLKFGNSTISYTLRRKQLKRISLTVHPDQSVEVKAPSHLSLGDIDKNVRRKGEWILEKQAKVKEQHSRERKEFLSGEKVLYLGRRYRIKRISISQPAFKDGCYLIPKVRAKEAVVEDYKVRSLRLVENRLQHIQENYGLKVNGFKIADQKTRWGSCDSKGFLRINWRVIMAPKRIVDYVLIHEITHLEISHHSTLFWKKVKRYLPDYEERKEWLRVHGALLDL